MAQKKSKPKSQHYPCVKGSPISAGPSANTLVDTARHLSVLNRRLYRFGRVYSTKVDVRQDYAGPAIEVFALRDDWAVKKAFQMAYQKYLENTSDERKNMSTKQMARWEDFRVRDGLTLSKNDSRPTMNTPAGGTSILNAGEFALSNVVDGAGTERTFSWGAGSGSIYSILEEYDKTDNQQLSSSSLTADGAYTDIDATTQEATSDNLKTDGNAPPYDAGGVNASSPWVRIAVLGGTAGVQRLSSGFFNAPCGLILLKGFTETSEAYSVAIEAKSGDYKGVHAPSMLE